MGAEQEAAEVAVRVAVGEVAAAEAAVVAWGLAAGVEAGGSEEVGWVEAVGSGKAEGVAPGKEAMGVMERVGWEEAAGAAAAGLAARV